MRLSLINVLYFHFYFCLLLSIESVWYVLKRIEISLRNFEMDLKWLLIFSVQKINFLLFSFLFYFFFSFFSFLLLFYMSIKVFEGISTIINSKMQYRQYFMQYFKLIIQTFSYKQKYKIRNYETNHYSFYRNSSYECTTLI